MDKERLLEYIREHFTVSGEAARLINNNMWRFAMEQTFDVCAGTPGAESLYYSDSDQEHKCVGHLRCDFGRDGDEFWTTFFPHNGIPNDGGAFRRELNALVSAFRKKLLRSRNHMRSYIQQHHALPLESGAVSVYGYQVTTDQYEYYIRCTPQPGYYDAYIYIYLREGR